MTTKATWQDKANAIIQQLCMREYRKANYFADGTKAKKHYPYHVPTIAEELVKCLGMHDQKAAEVKAKALFMILDVIPEWANA